MCVCSECWVRREMNLLSLSWRTLLIHSAMSNWSMPQLWAFHSAAAKKPLFNLQDFTLDFLDVQYVSCHCAMSSKLCIPVIPNSCLSLKGNFILHEETRKSYQSLWCKLSPSPCEAQELIKQTLPAQITVKYGHSRLWHQNTLFWGGGVECLLHPLKDWRSCTEVKNGKVSL